MPNPYKTYLDECCKPASLPAPWGEFASCPQAFLGPVSISEVHSVLAAKHSQEELITTGLMQLVDGHLVINPFLAMPEAAFLVYHDRTTGEISDLLTAAGSVRGRGLPLYTVAHDKNTGEALVRSGHRLYLTDTLADALVLRAAGLPAVPIHGLAEFTGENLQRLVDQYQIRDSATVERLASERQRATEAANRKYFPERPASGDRHLPPGPAYIASLTGQGDGQSISLEDVRRKNDESHHSHSADGRLQNQELDELPGPLAAELDDIDLAFVNWSPGSLSLDEPDAVRTAVSRLQGLADMWGFSIEDIEIWRPTPEDWQRIRSAVEEKRLDWFFSVVEESRGYDSLRPRRAAGGPTGSKSTRARAAQNLVAATRQLIEGDAAPGDRNQLAQRRHDRERKFRKAHHQAIAVPILEALTTHDPIRAAVCNGLAALTDMLAEAMISFFIDIARNNQADDDSKDKSRSDLLTISNQIAKYHDALSRTKPNPKPKPKPWQKK